MAGTGAKPRMQLNPMSRIILDSAFKVHSALGPGLLESAYQGCLIHELHKQGLEVRSEVALPVIYDGVTLDIGYRLDLLVEDSIIIEVKAIDKLLPIHQAQLLSYLKLSGKQLGFLMNFNVVRLKDGLRRVVNNFQE